MKCRYEHLETWRCGSCGMLLGSLERYEDKTWMMRVKYKDIFFNIHSPPRIARNCNKCFLWNILLINELETNEATIQKLGPNCEAKEE